MIPRSWQSGKITATVGGNLSGGIALLDRSLELNPNSATALAAAALLQTYSGDTAAAISLQDRAVRHNPLDKYRLCNVYMITYFVAGEYERVVEWSARALQGVPHSAVALRYRAASLGQLGRLEEGRQVVKHLFALVPNFTIAWTRRHIECTGNNIFQTPGVADALYEGLRQCGVP
jgi:adenylate cyclase